MGLREFAVFLALAILRRHYLSTAMLCREIAKDFFIVLCDILCRYMCVYVMQCVYGYISIARLPTLANHRGGDA